MSAKRILCFGDSITWGYDPVNDIRYSYEDTWPGVMETILGSNYRVITEALTGRTTCWDVPFAPYRSGKEYLPMLLESHSPLDLVIVMLGINDLMDVVGKSAEESSWGLISLVREILSPVFGGKPPGLLIISPPVLGELSDFNQIGFKDKIAESIKLPGLQKAVAHEAKAGYLDSNDFMNVSKADGVHPDSAGLRKLGEAIAKKVTEMKI